MDESELKPCPYCGGKAERSEDNGGQFLEIIYGCPACCIWVHSPDDWNTRPAEDALRAQLNVAQYDLYVMTAERDSLRKAVEQQANHEELLESMIHMPFMRETIRLEAELAAAREDATRLYGALEAVEGILFGPRFIPDPNTDDNLRLRALEEAKHQHDLLKWNSQQHEALKDKQKG